MTKTNETARATVMRENFTEEELGLIAFALSDFGDSLEERVNNVKGSELSRKLYQSRRETMLQARELRKLFG